MPTFCFETPHGRAFRERGSKRSIAVGRGAASRMKASVASSAAITESARSRSRRVCSPEEPKRPTGRRKPREERKKYRLHFFQGAFFTVALMQIQLRSRDRSRAGAQKTVEKSQIGRERPHFFGFQPPKKRVG